MARNRELVEFESESGDDEGSSEEVESQESDSEAEQTQTAAPKKFQPLLPVKSQQTPPPPPLQSEPPSSSEGEESGSETESDSDGPDSNSRPLASKPMEEAQKRTIKWIRSKPNAPEPVTPAKPFAAKRPRPSEDTAASKDGKKPKKSAGPEGSEKKPNFFQRLWSQEDEIFVLKGMMEYSSKNECDIDPISDILDGFYDFIKKSLHMDFSMTQLRDKIKRLKRKYKKNNSEEKKGKEMRFTHSHEQSLYELSKEIWGKEENRSEKVEGIPKANGRKKGDGDVKKAVVGSGEGDRVLRVNRNPSGEERMLRFGREIYEVEQGVEGEEEWSKLRVEEMELYLKQLELRVAQTKLLLNVVKPRVAQTKVLLKVVKPRYH